MQVIENHPQNGAIFEPCDGEAPHGTLASMRLIRRNRWTWRKLKSDYQQGLPNVVPLKPRLGPIEGLVVEPGLRPEPSTVEPPALLEDVITPLFEMPAFETPVLEIMASPGFMPELGLIP